MSSTTPPTVTPDLAALVAGLSAYRGSVAARTTQAATAKVHTDFDRRIREEDRVLQGLVRAGGLDTDIVTDTHGIPSPAAAVAAFAAGLVPLGEALLADSAVARALVDRARVARAASSEHADLAAALAEVEDFYAGWADWQVDVAAALAAGAVAELEPTTLQKAAARARDLAGLPGRVRRDLGDKAAAAARDVTAAAAEQARAAAQEVTERVNAAVTAAGNAADRTRDAAVEQATRAVRITDAAWTAGRDAALREGEHEADATGADTAAEVIHETRANLGVLDEKDLPIRGFDSLTVPEATKAIERLTDQHDIRVVDAYERAHKNRKTVLDAVLKHSTTLVDDTGR